MIKTSIFFAILLTSCGTGLKRVDGASTPPPSKQGVTMNDGWLSGGGIQKGFWCDVKGGILTFGDSGPTEAVATANAMKHCQGMIKDGSCKLVGCKAN